MAVHVIMSNKHLFLGVPEPLAMAEAYDSGSDETCSPERRRQGVQPQRSCLARLELLKRHLEVCCPGRGGWMDPVEMCMLHVMWV